MNTGVVEELFPAIQRFIVVALNEDEVEFTYAVTAASPDEAGEKAMERLEEIGVHQRVREVRRTH